MEKEGESALKSPLGQVGWRLSLAALILCAVLCSGCAASNNHPVISSLKAEKDWLTPLGSSCVECVASDADGDSLTYTWSATGGTFSADGPVATWVAPDVPGAYTITVTVTDGRGGEAETHLSVDVIRVNHSPVVQSLTAEPASVRQGKTSTINCVAADPDGDELSYQWAAARGSISGQGSAVTWTAPNTCGNYVVTVTVVDSRDAKVSKELEIKVKSPG